jgi:hypothetical protein
MRNTLCELVKSQSNTIVKKGGMNPYDKEGRIGFSVMNTVNFEILSCRSSMAS